MCRRKGESDLHGTPEKVSGVTLHNRTQDMAFQHPFHRADCPGEELFACLVMSSKYARTQSPGRRAARSRSLVIRGRMAGDGP